MIAFQETISFLDNGNILLSYLSDRHERTLFDYLTIFVISKGFLSSLGIIYLEYSWNKFRFHFFPKNYSTTMALFSEATL